MHIHGLLAADFHAHLLRWPGAHSQVGWILALSVEVPGNDGFRWAACIILQVTGFFFLPVCAVSVLCAFHERETCVSLHP